MNEKQFDNQYERLLAVVCSLGRKSGNRTAQAATSYFGAQMRFDMANGFPLITTKKVSFKMILAELLWFLSGSTNVKDLQALGCHIWDEWADKDGNLGPIYGRQWRGDGRFMPDQINNLIYGLKHDPLSRRHVVSAWNPGQLREMRLSPCHALFQCHTQKLTATERMVYSAMYRNVPEYRLSLQLYQRSADMFLGVPYNIASYSLLLHMLAVECNMVAGDFIWTGGDCHVYENHWEQVHEQMSRMPYVFPDLELLPVKSIFHYKMGDAGVRNYQHHAPLFGEVAV